MSPSAFAIKLPPLVEGPPSLKGKSPIAIFTEQGAANQRASEQALQGAPQALRMGGDLFEEALPPSLRSIAEGAFPAKRFPLGHLVVVLDTSKSMLCQVSHGDRRTRLELVKQEIAAVGSDFFPSTRISLISFNRDAERIALPHPSHLIKAISEVPTSAGTNFHDALKLTVSCLQEGPLEERKAVIFVSDGEDKGPTQDLDELARAVRGLGAFTFLLGAGANYKLGNHFALAQRFGTSAWGHTPMPEGTNAFGALLPPIFEELQSMEFYLKVRTDSPTEGFHWLTPSVRAADNGAAFCGFEQAGVGLCFVDPKEKEPKLTLLSGKDHTDPAPVETEINILTPKDAAAHFDELKIARNAAAPLLVLLAQLRGDTELLEKLAATYPQMAALINRVFTKEPSHETEEKRMKRLQGMSEIGTETARRKAFKFINPFSMIQGPTHQQREGHSGPLGPLTYGPSADKSIAPLGQPNPEHYDRMNRPLLRYKDAQGVEKTFDLFMIPDRATVALGRSPKSWMVVDDPSVSLVHAHLIREGGEILLADAGSRWGTFLNDTRLGEALYALKAGDKIKVGDTVITVAL